MNRKARVILLCCSGLYQRSLAFRISREQELVGLIRQTTPKAKGSLRERCARIATPAKLFRYLYSRKCIFDEARIAAGLIQDLFYVDGSAPTWPDVPALDVENINDNRTVEFIRTCSPDVLCINGTNLLREPLLQVIPSLPLGALNLHTGLSPYSRGGNCNLFMLLEGHPELVGVTVHHIDPGIDSGDIILSARPEMNPSDNFEMIEARVFRLGIDLMLLAIRQLLEKRAARVKQWEKGKLFLRKTGYVYHPYLRAQVRNLIQKGLIREYLSDRSFRDSQVRLIGERA